MNPKKMFPINAPTFNSDAIQDASSEVIWPDDSGVSSDINRKTLGLIHPSRTPKPTMNRFTVMVLFDVNDYDSKDYNQILKHYPQMRK